MDYGANIKAARKAAGLTQKQLADRLGISFVNISQLENNQRTPNLATLQRLADALGIHIFDLRGGIKMPEFLRYSLDHNSTVKVITTNGYQMTGKIMDVDTDFRAITLDIDGAKHFVFMSAISTITV